MQPKLSDPPRFLLMKTSSLGDVLHNLAVVSDLQRVFPGAIVDWCVTKLSTVPSYYVATTTRVCHGTDRDVVSKPWENLTWFHRIFNNDNRRHWYCRRINVPIHHALFY